ncbi:MAG: DMT family transporter [Boseongicola sp.]|nr:DMT family transporter [Boseongicola sp.]NNL18333.1 DMT family transporter [Boseongicola sp.]
MSTSIARPMNIALGVMLIVAAAFLISVQDVIVKWFDGVLPLWQLFALRGFFTAPLLLIFAWLTIKSGPLLAHALSPWALLRGFCIAFGLFGFYAALPFISLATAGAGIYLAPIFMTLFSARLLGEPVGRRGWVGVLLGFVGVLVLLKPGSDSFSPWTILPVIGASFYALGHTLTRMKCQHITTPALAFSYNVTMTFGSLAVSGILVLAPPSPDLAQSLPFVFGDWQMPSLPLWGALVGMGGIFAAIAILLSAAYKIAPPPTVGTFEYSYLIFAVIWDITVFGLVPNVTTLVGILLIVAAGMLVLRR